MAKQSDKPSALSKCDHDLNFIFLRSSSEVQMTVKHGKTLANYIVNKTPDSEVKFICNDCGFFYNFTREELTQDKNGLLAIVALDSNLFLVARLYQTVFQYE